MHKQWEAEEVESSRLIDIVLHGRDEDLVRHLAQLPPKNRKSIITHLAKDGNSALHWAALRERLGGLAAMLDTNVDVGIRNGSGESPLYVCMCHNALKSARLLINNGADANEITGRKDNESLLHKMVKGDRGAAVEILLDAGVCIDCKAHNGDTPLHFAARYNRPMIARQLVQGGANVNITNEKKETPLHTAVASKSLDVAKILIKAKAKVDVPDRQGMTTLHQAVASEAMDIVRLMLNNNSTHVNSKEKLMGRTPLLLACSGSHQKLAPLLLSHGADANLTTNYRKTVLHLAATAGNTHALNAVIKHASNLNALTTNNITPLHCAVSSGHLEGVRTLLRAGVNPNLKDIEGDTALHMAAASGDFHIAEQLLLQPGLHVNATNMRQRTALHAALMAGHEQTGELLMAAGCDSAMVDVFEKSAHDYFVEYQKRLRELEEKDWPAEHEASRVHFSAENGTALLLNGHGSDDAITDIANAQQDTTDSSQIHEDDRLQNDSNLSLGGDGIVENGLMTSVNGDLSQDEHDTVVSDNQLDHVASEYDEETKEERGEENECEPQYFEEKTHTTSPIEASSKSKKGTTKSRGRHRKISKSSNKAGVSSPRTSKSGGAGKGGRPQRKSSSRDGGGVLGMVMAGHHHEHHDHLQLTTTTKADHQHHQHHQHHHHNEQHPYSEAISEEDGGRRRKLGVASMK
ncbi:ankyrin-3-like [Elysia marginata]|uniref:Ankyrin-3-like n=1 Tax=Elysia marginata TaxID=1093978 RepID=A0AAV4EH15_9GAST|nr:ankyrin-3-like [Elysia marginata]